ncbi:MAG: type II restriction endonuclease [Candidatus Portnoybacteria bacterium CG10_big_fil_rev_8_21_14_0_10_38_18]|uniref:Type II restriction endonuclease n=1 Tax=Candidatus Portnoybacteria bacterium CG10_big_fil_rev_8_21_14_0_10_38_18 TaxID=1974813 RepID=A0A2M8KCP5_9BACT|nr:MAG: type II restriction endonuclease [Candidatus Portnoybacteria bacterium CG10_big_fil_rev_8_21_14_0_10_38_18]
MIKKKSIKLGSKTAKRGFKNEKDIVKKFNHWQSDEDAQEWLKIMNYDLKEIEKVKAIIITGSHKTDVQVQITIYLKEAIAIENLSVKLVSNPQGFNQIDKRWVDKYVKMWNIPKDITKALKLFTGEIKPKVKNLRDQRRIFFDEMDSKAQKLIVDFFSKNKLLIVSDILKGSDEFPAGWMMVVLKKKNKNPEWCLKHINHVLNIFGGGKVRITDKGSLKIGKITMQRKGGDAGRETSKMLQFKINPVDLFEYSGRGK